MQLLETIKYINFMGDYIKYQNKYLFKNHLEWKIKCINILKKLNLIKDKHTNTNFLKKLLFFKLCWQFYMFDFIIINDTVFYINFYELNFTNVFELFLYDFKIQ